MPKWSWDSKLKKVVFRYFDGRLFKKKKKKKDILMEENPRKAFTL